MDEVILTPEEAKLFALKESTDPNGPYLNLKGSYSQTQQELAIARVNRCQRIAAGLEPDIDGFVNEYDAAKKAEIKEQYGHLPTEDLSSNSQDF